MEKISDALTDFYIKRNYIQKDKKEIYSYGFQLLIADIINFTIVILLGVLLNNFVNSFVFLITLCSIRRYSGGFHAKTYFVCRTAMLVTFIGVLIVAEFIGNSGYRIPIILINNIVSIMFISVFSPIKHPNKKLSQSQMEKNKIKAIIRSSFFVIISYILVIYGFGEGVTISTTLTAIVLLMIIGLILQKGGKEYV